MSQDKKQIADRTRQWEIFNAWEATSQKIMGEPDLLKTFRWYGSAWEMARAQNPACSRQEAEREKVRRLQKIREALTLIGKTHERP